MNALEVPEELKKPGVLRVSLRMTVLSVLSVQTRLIGRAATRWRTDKLPVELALGMTGESLALLPP